MPVAAAVTVLAGLSAAALIMMGVRGTQLLQSHRIFPNISIGGVSVGGMTAVEAHTAVKTAMEAPYGADFEINLPDRTVILDADELSVRADAADAVAQAMAYGRQGTAFDALAAQETAVDIPAAYTLTFDEVYLRGRLLAAAADSLQPKILPTTRWDHTDNVITVTLGTDGQFLDASKLYDAVLAALHAGRTSLQWDYTADPAGTPDLTALHAAAGQCFDLAEAEAKLAACNSGESFTVSTE